MPESQDLHRLILLAEVVVEMVSRPGQVDPAYARKAAFSCSDSDLRVRGEEAECSIEIHAQ
jgi:hypothetical protein